MQEIFKSFDELQGYINTTHLIIPMHITNPVDAIKYSIAKWHPWNPDRGYGKCGLCSYHRECTSCPYNQGFGDGCYDTGHTHYAEDDEIIYGHDKDAWVSKIYEELTNLYFSHANGR